MDNINNWRYLFTIPSFGLLMTADFKSFGITQAEWYPMAISFIIVIICGAYMLPLIDVKDEEANDSKFEGLFAFVIYLLLNAILLGFIYYYRLSITDLKTVYLIIGLIIAQTSIYGYFLSNLFPPKNKSNKNEEQDPS